MNVFSYGRMLLHATSDSANGKRYVLIFLLFLLLSSERGFVRLGFKKLAISKHVFSMGKGNQSKTLELKVLL